MAIVRLRRSSGPAWKEALETRLTECRPQICQTDYYEAFCHGS